MTRFQMLLKEETGAGFLARMAVMLPVFLIVYHLSAGPVRGRYTLPATTPEQLVSEESRAGIKRRLGDGTMLVGFSLYGGNPDALSLILLQRDRVWIASLPDAGKPAKMTRLTTRVDPQEFLFSHPLDEGLGLIRHIWDAQEPLFSRLETQGLSRDRLFIQAPTNVSFFPAPQPAVQPFLITLGPSGSVAIEPLADSPSAEWCAVCELALEDAPLSETPDRLVGYLQMP